MSISSLRHLFLDRSLTDLETRGKMAGEQIKHYFSPLNVEAVNNWCKDIGTLVTTRFTVILPDGEVIGDTQAVAEKMDSHSYRPEIIEALKGNTGSSIRNSSTIGKRMMYVAVPLKNEDGVDAVIRMSIPLTAVDDEIRSIRIQLVIGGFIIAILASALCYYVSRRISRPIEEIRKGAERYAGGDLDHRLMAPATLEFASLSVALNKMAGKLKDRIDTVINQRNEFVAVLSSMTEGVIAVDMDERILSINQTGVDMLGSSWDRLRGRRLHEVFRNRDLQVIIEKALHKDGPIKDDVEIFQDDKQVWTVHASPLRNASENRIGVLLVMDNVTKLKRLETVRRDFVANVSHEIKTPLTAIKGFVETLRNGAIENPDEADRFLTIIEKHVNRLSAIVEDLLKLARIEQQDELKKIKRTLATIMEPIRSSIQLCRTNADAKNIGISLSGDESITAKIDTSLMEQALVNLIDNAIKFSPENSDIQVTVDCDDEDIIISVQDEGIGIPKKNQERLFERFYRIDQARSRKAGGTGLGLAIVKHIAQVHEGRVTVSSTLGVGSTFTIHLPVI